MKTFLLTLLSLLSLNITLPSQSLDADRLKGLEFRSIGPAFMSGRISDIAIDPKDENTWYAAVASGNLWKTVNAGVTWEPIFDDQSVFATGCVTIDPSDSNTIWLGTGENVGGRHLSWGDGVYKSTNGGKTWKNVGLPNSEHVSKILIHPENSNVVWVASQGPLWSKGGQRGIFKSMDGGETWIQTLGNKEWTGATELLMDPRNHDVLYAATWDRHRTVAAYMGGGPGSGIHKSTDGGNTWMPLTEGIPNSNLGKIGLCISVQNPDVLYAAIETDLRTGGIFKSINGGMTWQKQSDVVSGATGPHYYQELYACPHNFDRLYLMDNNAQISDDGGKTFRRMNEKNKHGDNHSINFKASDPDYILMGTDGGIYETFDLCKNWRYMENLPITQFYDIAIDDAEPFYNVYGGTQDNSTEGGPSRTDNIQGIQNSDWRVVLNWDGHQPATEPGNPDIIYAQRQQGALSRIDMKTGQTIDIQPQPTEGEDYERFNWDAPILVSPHDPKQLFFASQRLWRSNNRGDSWTAISGDLTRNENRFELPIMGRKQSINNAWDVYAMSNYNTITMVDESPVQRDLLYVGTDDGLIQVSENNGETWSKMEASKINGVPKRAYINDIKADLFDANVAYLAMDNHKEGDYRPFIYKTTDKGKTWKSIVNNLPQNTIIWRIVQDHIDPNLLFIGTEFGIYVTTNGGQSWVQMKGGLPTISFRDLKIQRRENDLVAASFGRSIYILDDYSSLRYMNNSSLSKEADLYPLRDALWYIPRSNLGFDPGKGTQGDGHFMAKNPEFGAVFTYHLKGDFKSDKDLRLEKEKEANKNNRNIDFIGWDKLDEEANAEGVKLYIDISDNNGNSIRRLPLKTKKGIHRVAWDLRHPSLNLISDNQQGRTTKGFMVVPGTYNAHLVKVESGITSILSDKQTFNVKRMQKSSLQEAPIAEVESFWQRYEEAKKLQSAITNQLNKLKTRASNLEKAITNTPGNTDPLSAKRTEINNDINGLLKEVYGSPSKQKPGQKTMPRIGDRLFRIELSLGNSTYGPTQTNIDNINICENKMKDIKVQLGNINQAIQNLSGSILDMGGPYIDGEVFR